MRLTLISLSLLVTLALLGCFNNGSDESVSRLEPVLTTPAPSASAETTLTQEPAAVPSPQPTGVPFTPAPSASAETTLTPEPAAVPSSQPTGVPFTPAPSASAETTLTPEPAAVPSSQPTGVPFTPAATPELPTTVLLGTTPGPAAASDASGNGYGFTAVTAGYDHSCGLRSNGTVLCWGRGLNGETEPPEATFSSVTAGDGYTCGIKTNGSVACWGIWGISYGMRATNTYRRPEAPAGVFKSISAGDAHACGIKADDTLACWGENQVSAGDFAHHAGQATPPPGTFRSVSTGGAHTCGLTTHNLVVCWGSGYEGPISPVEGSFLSVSAGGGHSCGVKTDNTVVCWGSDFYGQSAAPAGRFASVSAGGNYTCGLRMTGELECWGWIRGGVTPPQGKFLSVSVGNIHSCAGRSDGAIACWGRDLGYRTLGLQSRITCGVLPNRATVCPGEEGYDLLAAVHTEWVNYYDHNGSPYPCGNVPDGKTVCWDPYEETFVGPTPREVAAFSAGDDSACWLLPDGTVGCWGRIGSPVGTFQSVVVGEAVYRGFACAVRSNGELACWGDNGYDWGNVFPPEGTFKSVSAGYVHACAIKMDDTVVCWGAIGDEYGGRGVPSSGPFRSLGDGSSGAHCGIRLDATLDCWGGPQALPGTFQSVSVSSSRGGYYYCAVRTDGALACFGNGSNGITTPPEGEFQSVSLGRNHACGVRVDGAVACWGSNTDYEGEVIGQATPPGGQFLSVGAGREFTCGIRIDYTLACWGRVPEVLQNLSGIKPPSSTAPEPTPTLDIWSLPLREQLDLEMDKPGNLVANVGGDVDRIYRFVGMMTEAERGAVAEETQLYFEELGPPRGKASLHTYARIWLELLEAFVSPEKEFDDYYSISEYRLKVPFYVYMPAYLPPGFRYAGVGVSGGGDYSTAWFLHFERSSETYPQLESGQEERITFVQSTNDQKGNPFRETLDRIGGGHKIELPNLEEAGGLDARYWLGPSGFGGQDLYIQVAWEDLENDTFAHVVSHLSLEETLKVIRSLR